MKPIKDPFITTVRNLKITSGTKTAETLDKIVMYGVVSDKEQEFLERFGKIDQKEAF